ncbi:MAG TPA: hypothetical protein VFI61_00290 [Patescibacteria group bacterium]|nr:hypothetical protein [Patescibacteria group bacterium]
MALKTFKTLILSFIIIIGLGNFYSDFKPRHDFYPFYAWDLFSRVPNDETAYFLRVKKIGNEDKNIILTGGEVQRYLNIDFPQDYHGKIQNIANRFLATGSVNEFKSVEAMFKTQPVQYELVELKYNPLDLIRYQKVISEKVLYTKL